VCLNAHKIRHLSDYLPRTSYPVPHIMCYELFVTIAVRCRDFKRYYRETLVFQNFLKSAIFYIAFFKGNFPFLLNPCAVCRVTFPVTLVTFYVTSITGFFSCGTSFKREYRDTLVFQNVLKNLTFVTGNFPLYFEDF